MDSGTHLVSLATYVNGRPHIAYAGTNGPLKHAYHDGSEWHTEVVDTTGVNEISLVLDAQGYPHVIYRYNYNTIKYAHYDGAQWHIESLPANGQYISLALDSSGYPHISYNDGLNLGYAYYDGSTWHVERVDGTGSPNDHLGTYTSLALDVADHPHISYHQINPDPVLKYAYHDGSLWHIQVADSRRGSGKGTSLALDEAGHPHIIHYNWIMGGARYAYHDGITWHTETIDDSHYGRNMEINSLALDTQGHPHVSYYVRGDSLVYAYRHDSGWYIEKVYQEQPDQPDIYHHSLAVDENGGVHIAYSHGPNLQYAVRMTHLADWSQLVFSSYRNGDAEIYIAKGDASSAQQRTYNTTEDITPDFNWGASQIAFVSTRDGNAEIYTMATGGTEQTRLTHNSADDYAPSWSPDNSKIAFHSYRDGNGEIYVMNADDSDLVRLTNNSTWDGYPTWSPDGSTIAFSAYRNGGYGIWTMNADGTGQQLLASSYAPVAYLDWSPDGDHIAFSCDYNGWFYLAMINADGTGWTDLLRSNALYGQDYLAPTWAPFGEQLVFSEVNWVKIGEEWYWTSAYVYRLDLEYYSNKSPFLMLNSGYDWWPQWQLEDILPPETRVTSPIWSDTVTFTVQWSEYENDLSGIHSWDIQYRDGTEGVWTDWLTSTLRTEAVFAGERAHTYYFRARALDYARNQEQYPEGDGDASTHVCNYSLPGRVLGNLDQPIFTANVQSIPAALNVVSSDANGDFVLCFDLDSPIDITVSRDGFGALSAMKGVSVTDTYTIPTFYLPPADDQILDGGFEDGDLAAWATSGGITPVLTTTAHTGDYAVMLSGSISPTQSGTASWASVIEQEVFVSPTLESPILSVLYYVVAAEPASDTLQISLIGATSAVPHTLPLTASGWVHQWWDISGWEGQTLTLHIEWYQGENTRTAGVIIDEVSLGSAIQGLYSVFLPLNLRNEPES